MLTHIHMMVYTWWCWHIYKEVVFAGLRCKFLWLAHWSKGEEVRSENELVAKTLASVN